MLIEVIGRIKGKEIIVDRLEPIDEFLSIEYDDTRFNIVIKCSNKDRTSKVKKRAIFGENFKKFEVAPRGKPQSEHLNGNPLYYDNSYQLIIKMKIIIIAGAKEKAYLLGRLCMIISQYIKLPSFKTLVSTYTPLLYISIRTIASKPGTSKSAALLMAVCNASSSVFDLQSLIIVTGLDANKSSNNLAVYIIETFLSRPARR